MSGRNNQEKNAYRLKLNVMKRKKRKKIRHCKYKEVKEANNI